MDGFFSSRHFGLINREKYITEDVKCIQAVKLELCMRTGNSCVFFFAKSVNIINLNEGLITIQIEI